MDLERYRAKRDPARSPEPPGDVRSGPEGWTFVIQKHAARRLHYDLRLELGGVLKSWAVTKIPSFDPAIRRLAVHVEDHPLAYGAFEGTIPQGEYGAGTVMLWDRGHWRPEGDPGQGYAAGKLAFTLDGEKLRGGWALIRMRGGDGRNWLLIKERDSFARPGGEPEDDDVSVASGRGMDGIAADPPLALDPSGVSGARRAVQPDRLAPMLATLGEKPPSGPEWLHEIKFDGYRLLARLDRGEARLFTRNGNDWTDRFPAIAAACRRLPGASAWIDGEAVVFDSHGASRFHDLQRVLGEGRDTGVVFQVFDLPYLDGWDLGAVPLADRKRLLRALVAGGDGPIRYTDHQEAKGPAFYRQACAFALEGVVSKRSDRPYRPGRGRDWIKAKCLRRQEFLVAGYTRPQGSRTGIGALILAVMGPDGAPRPAGRVGTGFDARDVADLEHRLEPLARAGPPFPAPADPAIAWVEPRLVVEVEFAEWTESGQLRHPVYRGLRQDRRPIEVVRESGASATIHEGDEEDRLARFRLTHPDRVLYPEQGLTKRALASYYLDLARWMLPHIAGRPLTLVRCPEGRGGECFYQRHPAAAMPKAVRHVATAEETLIAVDDVAGLIGLVQAGALEIHVWGSRAPDIERPDRIVFDLDPAPDLPWERIRDGALDMRARLTDLGLESFAKTTGGKGLHVVAPIAPGPGWDDVKAFAKAVVEDCAQASPDRYTANMAKTRRQGRIFVDYLRNQRGATAIAPYSTRARPGAPVAVPITWAEVAAGIRSDQFSVDTFFRRLAAMAGDPWAGMSALGQTLPPRERWPRSRR